MPYKDPEVERAYRRAKYIRNRDAVLTYMHARRAAADPQQVSVERHLYRRNHLEKARAKDRAYYRAHAEGCRAKARAYRLAHPGPTAAFLRWVSDHPDRLAAYRAHRRAKKAGNGGSHTAADWRALVDAHRGACSYCGRTDQPLTRDHKVPLSRGGTDDITNIVPACRPCNSRKWNRTAAEYLAGAGT